MKWTKIDFPKIEQSQRTFGSGQIYEGKLFFFGGGETNTKNNYLTLYNIGTEVLQRFFC